MIFGYVQWNNFKSKILGEIQQKIALEIIVEPQISIIGTAAVDVGSRDDKAAEFGARITVVAIKNIGADYHLQVLSHVPDRTGLQDSGWILNIVDAGKKYLEQWMQFHLDFGAQVVFAQDE